MSDVQISVGNIVREKSTGKVGIVTDIEMMLCPPPYDIIVQFSDEDGYRTISEEDVELVAQSI